AQVLPELTDLYFLMEKKFNPLQLCQNVKPKLDFLATQPTLMQYAKPLQDLLIVRLLQQVSFLSHSNVEFIDDLFFFFFQLSKVYETMQIAEFCKLASFVSFTEVEKLITDSVQK